MRISDWSSDVCSSDLATIKYTVGAKMDNSSVSVFEMVFKSMRKPTIDKSRTIRTIVAIFDQQAYTVYDKVCVNTAKHSMNFLGILNIHMRTIQGSDFMTLLT
jgi:hypothetical protein